jgi:hypothetical protein
MSLVMVCLVCGKAAEKKCGRCREVAFCTKACQTSAWPSHKLVCSPNVAVRQSEKRGMGVFAKASFAVGDELIREKVLFAMPAVSGSSQEEAEAKIMVLIAARVKSLKPITQRAVLELADVISPPAKRPTAYGVLKTNAIPLGSTSYGATGVSGGLFALSCRLNLSCLPNARYIWREDLQRELVFALRPITSGEEVTVNYIGPYLPLAKRQAHLQRSFRFNCACPLCSAPSDESDDRLVEIQQLIDDVPKVGYTDQRRALKMAERVLKLLRDEGRDTAVDMGCVHYDAFQMAIAIGDKRKAKVHMRNALNCAEICEGVGSPQAAKYTSRLGCL